MFDSPGGGVPLGWSPWNFQWMSMDGQGTRCRRDIAENFNRLSRAHERYRRQMTTDRRQTDGRQQIANVNVSSCSLKTIMSKLHEIFYTYQDCARGAVLLWRQSTCHVLSVCGWRHSFTYWAKCRYRLGDCDVANYYHDSPGGTSNLRTGWEVCYRRLPFLDLSSFFLFLYFRAIFSDYNNIIDRLPRLWT